MTSNAWICVMCHLTSNVVGSVHFWRPHQINKTQSIKLRPCLHPTLYSDFPLLLNADAYPLDVNVHICAPTFIPSPCTLAPIYRFQTSAISGQSSRPPQPDCGTSCSKSWGQAECVGSKYQLPSWVALACLTWERTKWAWQVPKIPPAVIFRLC